MPKKKAARTSLIKPSATLHPSLQNSLSVSGNTTSKPKPSVNDILGQLRRTIPSEGSSKPQHIPEEPVVATEQFQALRLISASNSPQRPHLEPSQRQRSRTPRELMAERRAARRPPGPRPPPSWLVSSRERSTSQTSSPNDHNQLSSKAAPRKLPGIEALPRASLRMLTLSQIADYWSDLDEEERQMLGVWLPPNLREVLLHLLAERKALVLGQDLKALVKGNVAESRRRNGNVNRDQNSAADKALLTTEDQDENEVQDQDEDEDSWEVLAQRDAQAQDSSTTPEGPIKRLVLNQSFGGSVSAKEVANTLQGAPSLPSPRKLPLKPVNIFLTELCLGPPLAAKKTSVWKDLLTIAPYLPQLTHLDLSYWPNPTSGTGVVVHEAGNPTLGTSLQDTHEASRRLFRVLGSHLSSLVWLSIEGCNWTARLAPSIVDAELAAQIGRQRGNGDFNQHTSPESNPSPSTPSAPNTAEATPSNPTSTAPTPADTNQLQMDSASSSSEWSAARRSTSMVDWIRTFTRLQTLRLSPEPEPLVANLLSSRQTFQSFADSHTLSPGGTPFPPYDPSTLIRVPEPEGRPDPSYEGPQWIRREVDGSTSAFTRQPAFQVKEFQRFREWLWWNFEFREIQAGVRIVRARAGVTMPFSVMRVGVDDGDFWVKEIVGRWADEHRLHGLTTEHWGRLGAVSTGK